MKGYIASVAARRLFVFLAAGAVIYAILSLAPGDPAQVILGKPAIYLYPQEETEVFVNVNLAQGQFDVTEPALGDGWRVTARPDGVLTDETGQNWPYLFWEASCSAQFDFSQGFVVPGRQAEEFLLLSLGKLGLNAQETADFMEFWLPQLEENPYNLIAFQQQAYTDGLEAHRQTDGNPAATPASPRPPRFYRCGMGRQSGRIGSFCHPKEKS